MLFYEKPGCINNKRQKQLLREAGHEVMAKNLLTEHWEISHLLLFFKGHPVADWFNRSAPAVKSGELVPEHLDARQALELMLQNPLLIRRPLMQVGEHYHLGFDLASVQNWAGLGPSLQVSEQSLAADLETCPRLPEQHACR